MVGRRPDRLVVVPGPCSQYNRNYRVQSRELEGRSCHVSLFAREPSSLQRSTTLSPCTLFSPNSGPTWLALSSHPHLVTTTLMMTITPLFPISLILVPRTAKPSHHLAALPSPSSDPSQLLNFSSTCPSNLDGAPPKTGLL